MGGGAWSGILGPHGSCPSPEGEGGPTEEVDVKWDPTVMWSLGTWKSSRRVMCACYVCVCMWASGCPLTMVPFLTGCPGMWDNITCWKPAHVGEMVLVSCPELFRIFNPDQGGFPRGASSGHSGSSLLPIFGPQAFLRDKHQRHRAPCRQIFPIPELMCWWGDEITDPRAHRDTEAPLRRGKSTWRCIVVAGLSNLDSIT